MDNLVALMLNRNLSLQLHTHILPSEMHYVKVDQATATRIAYEREFWHCHEFINPNIELKKEWNENIPFANRHFVSLYFCVHARSQTSNELQMQMFQPFVR